MSSSSSLELAQHPSTTVVEAPLLLVVGVVRERLLEVAAHVVLLRRSLQDELSTHGLVNHGLMLLIY